MLKRICSLYISFSDGIKHNYISDTIHMMLNFFNMSSANGISHGKTFQ